MLKLGYTKNLHGDLMTITRLSEVPSNHIAFFVRMQGHKRVFHRLAQMGLLEQTPIKVIKNVGRGALLIEVMGSKLILGRKIASDILVRVN